MIKRFLRHLPLLGFFLITIYSQYVLDPSVLSNIVLVIGGSGVVLWAYWRYNLYNYTVGFISAVVLLLGILSNGIVKIANGGVMPVAESYWRGNSGGGKWTLLTDEHKFAGLADILPYGFSAGDVLIITGLAVFIVLFAIRHRRMGVANAA